jgi:hypothetical protein
VRLGHDDAVEHLRGFLREYLAGDRLVGVGHRVVDGSLDYTAPVRVDASVLKALEQFVPLAPLHQPHTLSPIAALLERAPELLAILGLPSRRGLPRIAIEQALLAHGADVLDKQLDLNPRDFRLVCIPPDIHLRLGERESWGRQPGWTHFDGYLVMADGRLRALAGGDVRYGGLYDLLGISRDYDSDRVLARFAVVRRERMVAW